MDARGQAHERTPRVPLLLELVVVIDRETLVSPFFRGRLVTKNFWDRLTTN